MNRSLRTRHVKMWLVVGLIVLPLIILAFLNIPT